MGEELPDEIEADLGELLSELRELGFNPRRGQYDAKAFGNYYVDVDGAVRSIRITRDRGQYILWGEREQLEPAGLWKAFDDKREFSNALLDWIRAG